MNRCELCLLLAAAALAILYFKCRRLEREVQRLQRQLAIARQDAPHAYPLGEEEVA